MTLVSVALMRSLNGQLRRPGRKIVDENDPCPGAYPTSPCRKACSLLLRRGATPPCSCTAMTRLWNDRHCQTPWLPLLFRQQHHDVCSVRQLERPHPWLGHGRVSTPMCGPCTRSWALNLPLAVLDGAFSLSNVVLPQPGRTWICALRVIRIRMRRGVCGRSHSRHTAQCEDPSLGDPPKLCQFHIWFK
ncbi:hypothetical protein GY45DRAFT_797471 [Cubamyces sp. BRFM 1775]|nr:hypothetical protein GY45DRAFT_797471 [Cubamyces sp. BRFM 1775]